MCTTGSEDAVTVQAGTFSWDRNDISVLEKYVCCSMHDVQLGYEPLKVAKEHETWFQKLCHYV